MNLLSVPSSGLTVIVKLANRPLISFYRRKAAGLSFVNPQKMAFRSKKNHSIIFPVGSDGGLVSFCACCACVVPCTKALRLVVVPLFFKERTKMLVVASDFCWFSWGVLQEAFSPS